MPPTLDDEHIVTWDQNDVEFYTTLREGWDLIAVGLADENGELSTARGCAWVGEDPAPPQYADDVFTPDTQTTQ